MSSAETLANSFKPDERNRGQGLLDKDLVVISSLSDTGAQAFIKDSSRSKVTLVADSVASQVLRADCTCSVARKGNLCKHVWAVLLKLEQKDADFLHTKSDVEKVSTASIERRESTARQVEYKKQHYEKQKARVREIRQEKKRAEFEPAFSYPAAVEEARNFFAENGFPLPYPIELEDLLSAKKLLSRVFHPDKGGNHEETVTLNRNFDVIYSYLKS